MTGTPQTREKMEARAQALRLQYPANIKDATLAKKIAEAEAKTPGTGESTDGVVAPPPAEGAQTPVTQGEGGTLVLEVTGPAQGRRRIGRRFTREPQIIRADDLSEAEAAALTGDETLTIRAYHLAQVED